MKRTRYNKPWYTGDTIAIGIGQGYWTATPLQLAQAMSILTNKGQIKVPHMLKSTTELQLIVDEETGISSSTSVTNELEFVEKPPIVLSQPKNWDLVLDAMHNTVQKIGATAYSVFKGSKYDAAGKTGTAQLVGKKQDEKYDAELVKESQRHNAMFVSFAPYENPEIVVAVAVENVIKGGGGTNAGPVARQIMDQYFGDREITSKDISRHPQHESTYGTKKVNKLGQN
jgi:penicillin-binding protein 2